MTSFASSAETKNTLLLFLRVHPSQTDSDDVEKQVSYFQFYACSTPATFFFAAEPQACQRAFNKSDGLHIILVSQNIIYIILPFVQSLQ